MNVSEQEFGTALTKEEQYEARDIAIAMDMALQGHSLPAIASALCWIFAKILIKNEDGDFAKAASEAHLIGKDIEATVLIMQRHTHQ